MQHKCNQVVSLSLFPEFSGNGNIWGIPLEIPPNNEVTQVCARATSLHAQNQALES